MSFIRNLLRFPREKVLSFIFVILFLLFNIFFLFVWFTDGFVTSVIHPEMKKYLRSEALFPGQPKLVRLAILFVPARIPPHFISIVLQFFNRASLGPQRSLVEEERNTTRSRSRV